MNTSDNPISYWRRFLSVSFRHDVLALLLVPFVEASVVDVAEKDL